MGADFLKVDDDNLERILVEKGYKPTYTLPCVRGKSVYLHMSSTGINEEIRKYNSFLNKTKMIIKKYFWA